MTFFICIGFFFFLSYAIILFILYSNWHNHPDDFVDSNQELTFSIIIPMRNESQNIVACLDAVFKNSYSKTSYEVIVVDDHSVDDSLNKVKSYQEQIKILNADKTGKKAAINMGIAESKSQYIITMDADSVPDVNWLKTINQFLLKNLCDVLAAPVIISPVNNTITAMQFFDVAAMMSATAYGIDKQSFYLANGTNFVFKRDLFYELNGYEGNENIASGDDVFFINEAAKAGKKIKFIKDVKASVKTLPETNLKNLLLQRKRWASKTKAYGNKNLLILQGTAFLLCLSIITSVLLSPFKPVLFACGVLLFIGKLIIDYFFLRDLSTYFNPTVSMKYFLRSSALYIVLILYSGYCALFPAEYVWKDREYRDNF